VDRSGTLSGEMIWLHVQPEAAVRLDAAPQAPTAAGFHWFDLTHEQLHADKEALRTAVLGLTGVHIDDLHLKDAANLQHPSYFDSTADYQMLVFRKLTPGEDRSLTPLADVDHLPEHHRRGRRLQPIVTRPVTFFIFDRLMVTVRNAGSRTIEQVRQRLLESKPRAGADSAAARLPQRPEDLVLRLVNGMVDRYLELRQPLTDRLDRCSASCWTAGGRSRTGRRCSTRASSFAGCRTSARSSATRCRSCATSTWKACRRRSSATPTWCGSPT